MVAAFAAGAALTPGALSSDAGRVLVIFLGLVAASLLPTITHLINSMTASGRSVHNLRRLEVEIQAAMDALFLMFGAVGVSVAALVSLSIEPASLLSEIPYLTDQILPRIGQALVVAPVALVLWRVGQIPAILRRTLKVRYESALEEAKTKLADKAPDTGAMRQSFPTHPDFGKVISLQDLQSKDG
ncbi:hypothetical protein MGN01_46030 [Methylobacterium gnaphalii]|uniref:Uncharacterized protein n=1 Tax=Methylobacterium gnaphalii TaxID=1010610 RepID=A0A512JS28_9HYPH|nr:hypothetical protein MGN01_46030 [Methylobacterium gnaphalii]GLS49143.1 hypothetical protein GCM10007885_19910 [Methylobacterium gnaphalii]